MSDGAFIPAGSETHDGSVAESELENLATLPDTEIEARETPEVPEDVPMLDVHPPHETIHTWREYLLHMSTIVLGLLIAIGLEQSVEAVHRARERKELRESLQRETGKAIRDAEGSEEAQGPPLA